MNYSFSTEIANKYGVEEAIIYQNIEFWCNKNYANKEHIHDGRPWTYNTLNGWKGLFPFWGKDKIFKILKRMEEKGMIVKGHFPENPFDRTTFYSANLQNAFCHMAISDFTDPQNVHIADPQNVIKEQILNTDKKPDIDTEFAEFWKLYPKKRSKPDGLKAWKQTAKDRPPLSDLLRILESWKQSEDWKKDGGRFIPYPASWLRAHGWDDDLPVDPEKGIWIGHMQSQEEKNAWLACRKANGGRPPMSREEVLEFMRRGA